MAVDPEAHRSDLGANVPEGRQLNVNDWLTEAEVAAEHRQEPWMRLEAAVVGCLLTTPIVLAFWHWLMG
jgi:hypothetical protein